MTKIDYKKEFKTIYKPSTKIPKLIDFPAFQYISIEGQGAPEGDLFNQSIEALYGIAYTISMSYRNESFNIPGFNRFVVPPLEGYWSTVNHVEYDGIDKSVFAWQLRIMMPDFITLEILEKAQHIASQKKNNDRINQVKLIRRESKKHCIMMHIGSYDDEPVTFKVMEQFIKEQGYRRVSKAHEEIYLSDFRKTPSEKLKTVLVCEVEEIENL